jgi:hypothetical protein
LDIEFSPVPKRIAQLRRNATSNLFSSTSRPLLGDDLLVRSNYFALMMRCNADTVNEMEF